MGSNPQHASLPQSSEESSPFSMLKGQSGENHGLILRTRSLEEGNQLHARSDPHNMMDSEQSHHEDSNTAAAALHASFDAALLQDRVGDSIFVRKGQKSDRTHGSTPSWDDFYGDLSGKKHNRPRTPTETLDLNPPGTVRKLARRTGAASKTPLAPRARPPGGIKKSASSTPSSAVKRRRAHFPQGKSPMRRVPPTTSFQTSLMSPPSTSTKIDSSIFGPTTAALPPALTPTRQLGTLGTAKSSSKWNSTGTTVASTVLETTLESTDSVDTSSPTTTRFRFTSFPASLPRVNNPRSRECPDSVRKRMSFAETTTTEMNQSRDDDGTHNTSISSLSAEGHHQHLPAAPGALPGTVFDFKSPKLAEEDDDSTRPTHARLFAEEDKFIGEEINFGYSDDDTTSSPVRDIVGRTRLNFNSVLTPQNDKSKTPAGEYDSSPIAGVSVVPSMLYVSRDFSGLEGLNTMPQELHMELSRPYDQRRINSFPSSLSSNTHINLSGCEEGPSALTPARVRERDIGPATPREVQVHFPLEAECSPIPGIREDHQVHYDTDPHVNTSSDDSEDLIGDGLIARRTTIEIMRDSVKKSHKYREEASTGSDTTNGKSRRLRPMPDMSAFESNAVSSRGERSSDDSATLDTKGTVSSNRLTCPPTPIRTPAWANEGNPHALFGRQNSLITTKVLLSVPSQVLEGRCSLENSVLDDDSKESNRASGKLPVAKLANVPKMNEDDPEGRQNRITRAVPSVPKVAPETQSVPLSALKTPRIRAPPRLTRQVPPSQEGESVISFSTDFEILSSLGSGAFADVYKVRSVRDNRLYAVKRNRRQFRGKRDRDMALTEVQAMQRLQSVCAITGSSSPTATERSSYCLYLLFFYRAWQEDGYFFCQTELCCRDTCRELLDSLGFLWSTASSRYPSLVRNLPVPENVELGSMEDAGGRLVPTETIWKICHDVAAGLSHIHSHGLVHHDIKPSNIFFVAHPRFGAMCKIGDFGMAGGIGSSADGLEGDTRYMPLELLSSGTRQPSSDMFSFGLTLYEISTDLQVELPSDGPRWHELRTSNGPELPANRGNDLLDIIHSMTNPNESRRPDANTILKIPSVAAAGTRCDRFLRDYIHDIDEFDRLEEQRLAMDNPEDQTPRNGAHRALQVRSPSLAMIVPNPPSLLSPVGKCIQ